jgi:hypothetical protein
MALTRQERELALICRHACLTECPAHAIDERRRIGTRDSWEKDDESLSHRQGHREQGQVI